MVPLHDDSVSVPIVSGRSTIGRLQRWFALCVVAALLAAGAVTVPFANTTTVVITSFFPMYAAAMIVINLFLGALLLIKGASEHNDGTVRLGAAYLFVCLITILHAASFPGGLMPAPLIGTVQTAAWIWCSWHVGFGLAILQYGHLAGRPALRRTSVRQPVLVVVACIACIGLIATDCTEILPTLLRDGQFVYVWPSTLPWGAAAVASFTALTSVVCRRAKTPEHLWLIVAMVASCLDVCLTESGSARYTFGWYMAKSSSLFASLSALIWFVYDITCVYGEVAANNKVLQILARVDGLTGIANRRCFDELLADEFRRARRLQLPLAIVLLDIDYFKRYNDHYGHPAGDECLRRVSAAVQKTLWRSGDQPARYGGEEIAVLLPGADLTGAMVIGERIRLAIEALGIEHALGNDHVVTVSAGAASFLPIRGDETEADLVAAADTALYKAKNNGRNRVCGSLPAEQIAIESI